MKSFFEIVVTANKNEGSKRGDMAAANECIDNILLGMYTWIGKGN